MDKHITPVELQKIIKKNKRRSKKALFVLLEKNMDIVSVFYKEPQQERKIFIAFDVVLNLDLFNENTEFNENLFFNDLNLWRPPIKITKQLIEGAQIPQSLMMSNIYQQYLANHFQANIDSHSNIASNQNVDLALSQFYKDSSINNNFVVEVELDTHSFGTSSFGDFATILKSFSNQKAKELATHLIKYQEFVQLCLDTYKTCEKNMMRIHANFQEENILQQLISDSNANSFILAHQIICEAIKKHKYVSYIIKINKGGQQLLHKFGYSRAFLDVMGISGNYEKFFMRRGPINPYNPRNRLDRLIKGLYHKSNGFFQKQADNYTDCYYDEDLHTLDGITFTCDFKNEKYFLNNSDQYFVKAGFLMQISTFDIQDKTIDRIMNMRQKNGMQFWSGQTANNENDFQDLQYTCESEIFINRYYA